jgi:Trypsin-co-occurring domain 1
LREDDQVDGETEILVRVIPDPAQMGNLSGSTLTERFNDRVRELGEGLGQIANDLRDQLDRTLREDQDPGWGLEEVSLSFSLDLEAGAGVVLAKGKASAGFEASMVWKRRSNQG